MSDSFVRWYRSTPTATKFASLVDELGKDGIMLHHPETGLSYLLTATGNDVEMPLERIAELVDHAVADVSVEFWLDDDFDTLCGFSFEGKYRQRLNFSMNGLPYRHIDRIAQAVLRVASDNLDERCAVIIDRDGRTAEFDWDTVVWRSADEVLIAPDVMLLPSATADRIAHSLGGVRLHEHSTAFTICLRDAE